MEIFDKTFHKEVIQADLPVLIEFWASWCVPCKMMDYVLKELEQEYDGEIKIVKLNVDRNRKIPRKFKLTGVPTFMVFKEGKVFASVIGAQSKKDLIKLIEKAIK